ncbi:MAG: acyltransferase [Vicingaceae bacterium]|nr:acyltransferase [Vicingaceae bacterium]
MFRTLAILLVVLSHGKIVSKDLFNFFPSTPLIDGVELFFVLSGFLIGSILIKQFNQKKGFSFVSITNFWKRRWFRTLPNYYLILLVNFLLIKYDIIAGNIEQFNFKFLFFLQNFSTGFTDFFWESWSLSVEEWFYISIPLLLFVFNLFLNKKTTILVSILILILAPLMYRISISEISVDDFWWDINFRKVVLTRLDAIGFGVLAAYLKYYHNNFWIKHQNWMLILGIGFLITSLYIPIEPNSFYSKTFYFSLVSIGAMLLISKADSIKTTKHTIIKRIVTHISKISYSMYLVNLALVAQVIDYNFTAQSGFEKIYLYLLYWSATIIISSFLYRFFEKPMMNLRDRF